MDEDFCCPVCGTEISLAQAASPGVCGDCHPLENLGVYFNLTLTVEIGFSAAWSLRNQKMVPGQPPQITPELISAIRDQMKEALEYQSWEQTITVGPVSQPKE